jgi:hypothetical protein
MCNGFLSPITPHTEHMRVVDLRNTRLGARRIGRENPVRPS